MNARMISVALVALLTLAGCGAKSGSSAPKASSTSRGSGGFGAVPDSPGVTGSPLLQDGRSPVYLTAIDTAKRTVTFDLIVFLTGDEAKKAFKKANPGSTQDGPDNDYFIVNDNPLLRTLPVATTVQITTVDGDPGHPKALAFADVPAHFAKMKPDTTDHHLTYSPYWLTVLHGEVTKMEEQFIP